MPNIYLKHEIHGTKVAISEAEAEHDRNLGWEDFDPTVPEPKKKGGRPPKGEVPNFLAPKE